MTKRATSLGAMLIATLLVSARVQAAAPKHVVVIASPTHAMRDELARELRFKDFRVDVLASPPTGCFGEDAKRFAGTASGVVCVDEQVHLFVRHGSELKHVDSLPIVNNDNYVAALRAAETMRVRLETKPNASTATTASPSDGLAEWDDSAPARSDVHLPPLAPMAACATAVDRPVVVYVTSRWQHDVPERDEPKPEAGATLGEGAWERNFSVALGTGFIGDLSPGDFINTIRGSVSAAPLPWLIVNAGGARFFSSLESTAAPRGTVNAGLRLNLSNAYASLQAGLGAAAVYRFKVERPDNAISNRYSGAFVNASTNAAPRTVGSEWVATPYVDGALDLRLTEALGLSFEARLYGFENSSANTWGTPIETSVLLSFSAF